MSSRKSSDNNQTTASLLDRVGHMSVSCEDRLDHLDREYRNDTMCKHNSYNPMLEPSYIPDRPNYATSTYSALPIGQTVRWVSAASLLHVPGPIDREPQRSLSTRHRGLLSMAEKYSYDLSKAQLKASSNTSALLAGFAMVALVELQYESTTPKVLLIILGVVTTLLVSVHLLALMMSTCILPYMEAAGPTKDSPHKRLKFFVQLSWLFSTCIGLLLFLIEIGVIFFVKFDNVNYYVAAYITTAMLVPVVIVFIIFSYMIHRRRTTYTLERVKDKVAGLNDFFDAEKGVAPIRNI